jgi:hypothetical protein
MARDFSAQERSILEELDAALRRPGVRAAIEAIARRVEQKLAASPQATLAWEPVPLGTYGALPEAIRSSWVFVLRAGTTSGAERHPNSQQRMVAWRGTADMQTWENSAWRSNVLVADSSAPLEARWISIPVNVWHKPVMRADTWVVVSFHTATHRDLIEERGDPAAQSETRQETYAARSDARVLGSR